MTLSSRPEQIPNVIQMAFGGIQDFEISRMGDLVLHTEQGNIRQSKPVAYQEANGVKEEVLGQLRCERRGPRRLSTRRL